jgi:hypothetical protein
VHNSFTNWVKTKWARGNAAPKAVELLHAYDDTFSNLSGQLVLHDLIDKFLMVTPNVPNEAIALARHAGHCDVIHIILENIDLVRYPQKYQTEVMTNGSNSNTFDARAS